MICMGGIYMGGLVAKRNICGYNKSVGDVGDVAEGWKVSIEVLFELLNILLDPTPHPPHPPHISHERLIEHLQTYTHLQTYRHLQTYTPLHTQGIVWFVGQ